MLKGSVIAAVLALLLLGSAPALAQIVSGSVVDENTGGPVAGASVLLVDTAGVIRGGARTDSAGTWSLRAPLRSGWFSIRVQKAGYAMIETARFLVGGEPVAMKLTTRPELVILEEVTSQQLAYDAFVSRRERRMGYGIGPDEIAARMERIRPTDTARLLSGLLPGMEASRATGTLAIPRRPGGQGCSPAIVLDGRHLKNRFEGVPWEINDVVPVWEIRAVEVYTDPWFIPSELGLKYTAEWPCGVVLIWTYRGIGER